MTKPVKRKAKGTVEYLAWGAFLPSGELQYTHSLGPEVYATRKDARIWKDTGSRVRPIRITVLKGKG